MTECNTTPDLFPACKSRKIGFDFTGGDITSDAGSLLLRQVDRRLGLTRDLSKALSGYGKWRMMQWCDRHGVGYIIGLAKNSRINAEAAPLIEKAERLFNETGEKQRLFTSVQYAAKPWDKERRIIVKAEHSSMGSNPRYVATNLPGDPQKLYDRDYVMRGDMENRIKEQQLDMFSDRTSCHNWWPNQLRMMLSGLAYVLVETIRRTALKGTAMANAQCGTIRLKLLKIGCVIIRNTRRIRFHASSAYPYQSLFLNVARRLAIE